VVVVDVDAAEERVERREGNHVNHAVEEGDLGKRKEEGHVREEVEKVVKKLVVEDVVKILVNNLINIYVEITLGAIFIVINS